MAMTCPLCNREYDNSWRTCLYDSFPLKTKSKSEVPPSPGIINQISNEPDSGKIYNPALGLAASFKWLSLIIGILIVLIATQVGHDFNFLNNILIFRPLGASIYFFSIILLILMPFYIFSTHEKNKSSQKAMETIQALETANPELNYAAIYMTVKTVVSNILDLYCLKQFEYRPEYMTQNFFDKFMLNNWRYRILFLFPKKASVTQMRLLEVMKIDQGNVDTLKYEITYHFKFTFIVELLKALSARTMRNRRFTQKWIFVSVNGKWLADSIG